MAAPPESRDSRLPQLPPQLRTGAFAAQYRVEREIGSGGMATVFLAEDLKHHRKVAVKVLRHELAASLGAKRFLREIEIAAQLQHPNILPLLDSGAADGVLYYVMPFVDGHSLRERLGKQGELPVGEAVRLIAEIVDALAYAHAHGVVHRDIKPDNVMLSGRHALVTDFGIARAVSEASGALAITSIGVALGTPAYMSPEQAVADPHVDHRADIYAIGAVAYELLTGQPPFTGHTPQQVLAAHLNEAPVPVSKHRDAIPRALEDLVMKCLAKRPADRWQRADDMLPQLEQLTTPTLGLAPSTAKGPAQRRSLLPYAIGGVAALVITAVAVPIATRHDAPPFVLGQPQRLTADAGLEVQQALSPDGRRVAYAAGTSTQLRIFVRDVAGGRASPLTDDSSSVQEAPQWSPADSSTILFLARGGVFTAPGGGGTPQQIVAAVSGAPATSATWSPDGREVAFQRRDTLYVQAVAGGAARAIGRGSLRFCRWSPSGRLVACVVGNTTYSMAGPTFGNLAPSSIRVFPVAGGSPVTVTDSLSINQSPTWSPDGNYLYFVSVRGGASDVFAVRVSSNGSPRGEPVRLTTSLRARSISLSADGRRMVYSVYSETSNIWAIDVPTGGAVSASGARQITRGQQVIEAASISPDGKWLVYDSDREGTPNIYRQSLAGGEPVRLTRDSVQEFGGDLSPNGHELAFHSYRTGSRDVFVMPIDGGPLQQVTNTPAQESYPAWSPDGRHLVMNDQSLTAARLLVATRNADGTWANAVERASGTGLGASWSADGTVIVATRNSGIILVPAISGSIRDVYTPRPGTADPRAEWARWLNATTIVFKSHTGGLTSFWSVPANGGTPRLLVRFDDPNAQSYRSDWATDGKRLYFPIQDRQSDLWMVELRDR